MPNSHSLVAVLAMVAGLALGACSQDARPEAKPSVARPTPAVNTTPPASSESLTGQAAANAAIPKAARAHTNAGAQAFFEFYIDQLSKAWMTADASQLRPYATKNCQACANYVDAADKLRATSQRFTKAPVSVRTAVWLPESKPNRVLISTVTDTNATERVDAGGKVVARERKGASIQEAAVIWTGSAWSIDGIYWVETEK